MKHLLAADALPVLANLARERSLCAFDFDGTLAPIVDDPDRAAMRGPTRDLLRRLASLYPCIILSGRARADLLGKLKDVPTAGIFGSHGADTGQVNTSRYQVEQWKKTLEAGPTSIPGVWIEDKGLSLSVHYRKAKDKTRARRAIFAATKALDGARIFGGKMVVNAVLAESPHKGDALAAERTRLGCNWVLFVGDDENDEEAFALDGNVVPVRVGRKRNSHARYYLRAQAEIDELLAHLIRLREDKAAEDKAGEGKAGENKAGVDSVPLSLTANG